MPGKTDIQLLVDAIADSDPTEWEYAKAEKHAVEKDGIRLHYDGHCFIVSPYIPLPLNPGVGKAKFRQIQEEIKDDAVRMTIKKWRIII